ncbi:hypothetical protein B5P46_11835 [Rhizobium leguminosarum]|uniref:Uncharacterized protein n=1 Tax=Rhizobium leguminosarum TaxID=384 RepID=A0A4Q1UEA6_RHILE|nr:hypothetical protein [Rhizobium leguminosarum]RXT29365.1 hypothetical protein B5P46_11835 [Rhizobium leguminosarum]
MKTFLDRLVMNTEGGGGGAPPPAAASAPPPAAAPPAAAESAAPPPSAAAAPPAGGAAVPPAGDLYKPAGLADHYLGASNNETIDKMAKALDGYRARDAANNVPDKIEAYSDFGSSLPPEIAPHVETLKGDPLYARMAEFALEHKLPAPVYQGLVKNFLAVSQEMGLLEPPVDAAAEKAALVPETARHLPPAEQTVAREKRMNENNAFIDAAVKADPTKEGGIDKDTAEFAKAMLGDTARGHQFIEWVKSIAGGGPQQVYMGGNAPNAGDPKAELRAREALPENTWGHQKFDKASYDQLQADYKKIYGN